MEDALNEAIRLMKLNHGKADVWPVLDAVLYFYPDEQRAEIVVKTMKQAMMKYIPD